MRSIIHYGIARLLIVSTICSLLFSFTHKKGGEGFEIFLDQQVLLQQFGNQLNTVKSISLDQSPSGKMLTIKYHHCGVSGTKRSISIRNEKNTVLKEWRYPDAGYNNKNMSISVSELLKLKSSAGSGKLKLHYLSAELPNGRVLASL
jgi:hypothetical protein